MTDCPKLTPELVQRWMEGCGGSNIFNIVYQIACKAAAWGYSQPKPESPTLVGDQYEYIHISYRKDCPF